MERISDELIRRARDGDREAFDAIIKVYGSRLCDLIRSQIGECLRARLEVADLLQETLILAYQGIRKFRGEGDRPLERWLCAIAVNVVQGQGRRHRCLKARLGLDGSLRRSVCDRNGWADLATLRDSWKSPSGILSHKECLEHLDQVMKKLSADHQEVILLARFQGLAIRDVARKMRRSSRATSMLLIRAVSKLGKLFGNTKRIPPARNGGTSTGQPAVQRERRPPRQRPAAARDRTRSHRENRRR